MSRLDFADESSEITADRLQELRRRLRELVDDYLPGLGAYVEVSVHGAPAKYVALVAGLRDGGMYVDTDGHTEYDVSYTPVLDKERPRLSAFGRSRGLTREHCPACKSEMDCALHPSEAQR